MGPWVDFGPIWTADSNSTWKTTCADGFRSVFHCFSLFFIRLAWRISRRAFDPFILVLTSSHPTPFASTERFWLWLWHWLEHFNWWNCSSPNGFSLTSSSAIWLETFQLMKLPGHWGPWGPSKNLCRGGVRQGGGLVTIALLNGWADALQSDGYAPPHPRKKRFYAQLYRNIGEKIARPRFRYIRTPPSSPFVQTFAAHGLLVEHAMLESDGGY